MDGRTNDRRADARKYEQRDAWNFSSFYRAVCPFSRPFVCSFVCSSVPPSVPSEAQPARPETQRGEQTDGRTNGRKISPLYRTLSPIGAAALPPPMKTKEKVEQGKGTADHLMPLGYLMFETRLEVL